MNKKDCEIITFVIVTWNNSDVIIPCLDSIVRYCKNYRIIIVDNNSTDNTVKIIKSKKYKNCTVYSLEKNLGFAAGNNFALEKVDTEYVCFLNPDTILLEDIVEPSVKVLRKNSEVGLVSCKLLNKDLTLQPSTFNFLTSKEIFSTKYKLTKLLPNFIKEKSFPYYSKCKKDKFVDWTIGAEMILRTADANSVGSFSEEYYMYTEDMDLCKKISNLKKKVFYLANVKLIHTGGASEAKNVNYDKMNIMILNEFKFVRKFYGFDELQKVYGKTLRAYQIRLFIAKINIFSSKKWRMIYVTKMKNGVVFCKKSYQEIMEEGDD